MMMLTRILMLMILMMPMRDNDDDAANEVDLDWCLPHDWVSRLPPTFLITKLDLTCPLSNPHPPLPIHPILTFACSHFSSQGGRGWGSDKC